MVRLNMLPWAWRPEIKEIYSLTLLSGVRNQKPVSSVKSKVSTGCNSLQGGSQSWPLSLWELPGSKHPGLQPCHSNLSWWSHSITDLGLKTQPWACQGPQRKLRLVSFYCLTLRNLSQRAASLDLWELEALCGFVLHWELWALVLTEQTPFGSCAPLWCIKDSISSTPSPEGQQEKPRPTVEQQMQYNSQREKLAKNLLEEHWRSGDIMGWWEDFTLKHVRDVLSVPVGSPRIWGFSSIFNCLFSWHKGWKPRASC